MNKRKRGQKFWGRKSRFYKNGGGEEYQVVGNFLHPWVEVELGGEGRLLPRTVLHAQPAAPNKTGMLLLSTNITLVMDPLTIHWKFTSFKIMYI